MTLSQIVPPAVEPITYSEALAHCRIGAGEDPDQVVPGFIAAARAFVETYTRRKLITQTWQLRRDVFERIMVLPIGPIASISQVTYLDPDGVRQTLPPEEYRLIDVPRGKAVTPAYGVSWPSYRRDHGAIEIDIVAGYGSTGADVPDDLLQPMRLLISHFSEHREAVEEGSPSAAITFGVHDMLAPYILVV